MTMINNEKGVAVITTVFIMVSFLSAALLVTYPLNKAVKDHSEDYNNDRYDYRAKKAMFGELTDQCGTKLTHVRSFYGDYPGWGIHAGAGGGGGRASRNYEAWYMSRRCFGFGTRVGIVVPEDYKFADGFWSGYHGKRYVRRLPIDNWGYNPNPAPKGEKEEGSYYRPFGRPPYDPNFYNLYIQSACSGGLDYNDYAKQVNFKHLHLNMEIYTKTVVDIRDYRENAKTLDTDDLNLASVGALNITGTIYFDLVKRENKQGYVLYRFMQQIPETNSVRKIYSVVGQKKLMILVRENGRWRVRQTKILAQPVSVYPQRSQQDQTNMGMGNMREALKTYRINFYG